MPSDAINALIYGWSAAFQYPDYHGHSGRHPAAPVSVFWIALPFGISCFDRDPRVSGRESGTEYCYKLACN